MASGLGGRLLPPEGTLAACMAVGCKTALCALTLRGRRSSSLSSCILSIPPAPSSGLNGLRVLAGVRAAPGLALPELEVEVDVDAASNVKGEGRECARSMGGAAPLERERRWLRE